MGKGLIIGFVLLVLLLPAAYAQECPGYQEEANPYPPSRSVASPSSLAWYWAAWSGRGGVADSEAAGTPIPTTEATRGSVEAPSHRFADA